MENDNKTPLFKILANLIAYLQNSNEHIAASCNEYKKNNVNSRLKIAKSSTLLPVVNTFIEKSNQESSNSFCNTAVMNAVHRKKQDEDAINRYRLALPHMQMQASLQNDSFVMMPFHSVEAEVNNLQTQTLATLEEARTVIHNNRESSAQQKIEFNELEQDIDDVDAFCNEIRKEKDKLTFDMYELRRKRRFNSREIEKLTNDIDALNALL